MQKKTRHVIVRHTIPKAVQQEREKTFLDFLRKNPPKNNKALFALARKAKVTTDFAVLMAQSGSFSRRETSVITERAFRARSDIKKLKVA